MDLKTAKKFYIKNHPLGHMTVAELKEKAKEDDVLVFGDKAQMLQCFDQTRHMTELFKASTKREKS